jgi:uncharacterized protein involved in tolerance to divalent cations
MASFLVIGLATPATAATAGGACTQAGQIVKIGKNSYVCAKNPYFNKTKLTYVWDGCIELSTEYATEVKSTVSIIKTAEQDRLKIIQPALTSINSVIKWSPLIAYTKGSIVFGNNNYYVAVKASTNKGLTSTNIGATKFWKIYMPTYVKSSIGQAPIPRNAITMADRYVGILTSLSSKSTSAVNKMKFESLISEINSGKISLEGAKGDLDLTIGELDNSTDTTKSVLNLLEINKPELIKKCNPRY